MCLNSNFKLAQHPAGKYKGYDNPVLDSQNAWTSILFKFVDEFIEINLYSADG